MSSRPNEAPRSARPAWVVPAVVIAIAGALIAMILSIGGSDSTGTAASNQTDPTGVTDDASGADQASAMSAVERRIAGDPRALGNVDAPVVLVMFSDYQCPYCAKWNVDTLPAMRTHVDDGELRIEFHDINAFGPESERAARAALAAAEQDAYVAYHSALFEGGTSRSSGALSEDALVTLAGELGLDTDRFAADLTSPEVEETYVASQTLANGLGVTATPSFLIGGEPLRGAQPTDVFEQAFARALARAG